MVVLVAVVVVADVLAMVVLVVLELGVRVVDVVTNGFQGASSFESESKILIIYARKHLVRCTYNCLIFLCFGPFQPEKRFPSLLRPIQLK